MEESTKTVQSSGTKTWRNSEGLLHRLGGGPAIEWASGQKEWFVNGKKHRLDGPAIEWGGLCCWYVNDQLLSEEDFNNHSEVKAYRLKQKAKEKGHTPEEDVLLDMFA